MPKLKPTPEKNDVVAVPAQAPKWPQSCETLLFQQRIITYARF